MLTIARAISTALVFATLGGCATAVPPVEVTRFHVVTPDTRGSFAVEPNALVLDTGIEYQNYASAVAGQMERVGFTQTAGTGPNASDYRVIVLLTRDTREAMARRSPVSVGVGGSTGSYGSGLGLGIGIDLSGKPKNAIIMTLSVQIRRRSDSAAIWEGRAVTEVRQGTPAAQPGIAAAKLADALFRDYPGVSGRTITVK